MSAGQFAERRANVGSDSEADPLRNFLEFLAGFIARIEFQLKKEVAARCSRLLGERMMQDFGFVVITIVFFALSIGYVHFCERIR